MQRAFIAAAVSAIAVPAAVGQQVPPPGFKVAFIGDQGLGNDAEAVLALIHDEGADMVIHGGDFDYDDDPAAWEAQINAVLGADFPYFACIGNHDVNEFYSTGGYQDLLEARMQRLGVPWEGDLGALSSFRYQGIFVVTSEPGIFDPLDPSGVAASHIEQQLQGDDSAWRISTWHKNMRLMQVGGKPDETGWGVYEASRRGGAIIATAHEHSYSRTHLLSGCESRTVAGSEDTLVLAADDPSTPGDEGRSFVFVSGLGGSGIRDQELDGPWWASIYTSDQGANFGALFGTFHHQGDPCLASFYFKDIDGVVADEFLVRSTCGPCAAGPGTPGSPRASIFWRRPGTGANEIWLLDGTQVLAGSGALPSRSNQWDLAGTGDFDANGSPDMLWRHKTSGGTTIWLMDGAARLASGALPVLDRRWRVAGIEDFDGDGRADILWRDPMSGQNLAWFMDGAVRRPESGDLRNMSARWSVAGTGDFDGDGSGDILWRTPGTGVNRIWFMHGTTLVAEPSGIRSRPVSWKVAAAADFDGDGSADILWRRPSDGLNALWLMNGAAIRSGSGPLRAMSASWSVAGTADFDADGTADILWRRQSAGLNRIWFMSGGPLTPVARSIEPKSGSWIAVPGD